MAEAIRRGSRAADMGIRWGGDEFALLAPNTGREAARSLAERVRGFVAGLVAGGSPEFTVSVGVATLDPADECGSAERLMSVADTALYEAKRLGRNRVVHRAAGPLESP